MKLGTKEIENVIQTLRNILEENDVEYDDIYVNEDIDVQIIEIELSKDIEQMDEAVDNTVKLLREHNFDVEENFIFADIVSVFPK